MALQAEVVVDVGADGGELLKALHLPEAEHGSLASSEGQVAVLDPVVGSAADLLPFATAELVRGSTVAAQAIGGDRFGAAVALERLHRERERRCLVAALRDVALEHLALVVDGASEIDHLAVQLHVHFVEVPPPVAEAAHAADACPADAAGEERTGPVPPEP